jgi:IS30 family transposase
MRKRKLTESDTEKILKLASGTPLTTTEIADTLKQPRTTVYDEIQRLIKSEQLSMFTANKQKVFESLQLQLVNLADESALKTMLSKRGFTDVGILEDKIAMLSGKAVSVHDVQIRILLDMVTGQNRQENDVIDAESAQDAEIRGELKAIPLTEDSNIK